MEALKDLRVAGLLYLLALAGTCLAQVQGWRGLEYASKPLLMAVLSAWFYLNSRRHGDRFTFLVQGGLFFSWLGDVALMFVHRDSFFFLVGLGCFLLAQLCYGIAFAHNIGETGGLEGLPTAALLALGIGAYAFFFGWDLMPAVDEGMQMPVAAYMVAIASMGMLAAFRWRRTWPRSFMLVFLGALLFMASDSVLAWDRFRTPWRWASLGVMLPYAVGQLLIAAGALAHVRAPAGESPAP